MTQKINQNGLSLIKRWEGFRRRAYLCPAGKWTIGFGHTAGVKRGDTVTMEEAERLLSEDLTAAERAVRELIKVALTENQFSALVSWTFNLGRENLRTSTLRRRLNARNYGAVPDEMQRWNKVRDPETGALEVSLGLVRRRASEVDLWMSKDGTVAEDGDMPQAPEAIEIKSLAKSRTAIGSATAGAGGAGLVADSAQEIIQAAQSAEQHINTGTWVGLVLGTIILVAAGVAFYARIDDWRKGRR
ncbi:lysozyme [Roseospira marina]|uniref:Lysozyme n=1 Tax=Roseospira marina TaxID=140057 RepID=A0A5M6I5G4_9PROT|nr:lysozyme [Roseospira marina]KAA5603486.1 lysozyme [Roseospira marina]MBB4315486.1 lysozyme [Roseospira marina]MBB5088368.1 lysozyme [Roseospira marina]